MNNKIIVAGRNYCNLLTTARALGEAGYEVEVLKVFKVKPNPLKFLRAMKPDAYSKYVVSYKEIAVGNNQNAVVEALLNMAEDDKKLIIPVDDYVCSAVDNGLDELNKSFVLPNVQNRAGALVELMDKAKQKEIAKKSNLPMLDGWLVKCENGEFSIPSEVKYPCFIKPNVSMLSDKNKMRACKNEDELKAVLTKYASQGDFEMLVEELADIKQEYSILGVSTGKKAVTAGAFKVIEGGNHERKGVALVGELVDANELSDIIEKCNRFIESIGYTGMFDIDLIEDKNGKIYFVELNFRAGASTYALNQAGVNLFKMLADYELKGKEIEDIPLVNSSKRFVSEKVLMEEFARGDADISKIKKCMNEAEVFFVKNENDMKPYKCFKRYYILSALLRVVYKIKG